MLQWMYRTVLGIVLFAMISSAVPGIPMVVNGTVYINGELAPPGTVVKAMMGSEVKGSYVVSEKGIYGLKVENKPGSNTVDLYVNEVKSKSVEWGIDPKTVDLRVTISSAYNSGTSQSSSASTPVQPEPTNATTAAKPSSTATLQQTDLQNKGITNDSQGQATLESPGFEFFIFVSAVLAVYTAKRGKE